MRREFLKTLTNRCPHLEYRDVVLPVDLVGRGVEPIALLHVLVEDAATLHVAQAELAQVQLGESDGEPEEAHVKIGSSSITCTSNQTLNVGVVIFRFYHLRNEMNQNETVCLVLGH